MRLSNIEKMIESIKHVEAALLAELKYVYPVGTQVLYKLRGGKDASRYPIQQGEIVGHIGGRQGRLKIKLALARSSIAQGDDRRYVTSIPVGKIIGKA